MNTLLLASSLGTILIPVSVCGLCIDTQLEAGSQSDARPCIALIRETQKKKKKLRCIAFSWPSDVSTERKGVQR